MTYYRGIKQPENTTKEKKAPKVEFRGVGTNPSHSSPTRPMVFGWC